MRKDEDGGRAVDSLSVVLPAYNEAECIREAVTACGRLREQLAGRDVEVVAVDDGSTDDTPVILKEMADGLPWLRVLRHDHNRGYGSALRTGFAAARNDLVFYTDADLQFDVGELAEHLHFIEDHDLVAGVRVYRYDPLARLVASWGYNRLVRLLFRVKVKDVDCSFKLMRRDRLDRLVLVSDDFFVDTELVARARRWKWRIVEVGVRHYPRRAGRTTVRPSDVPRTLRRVATMWREVYYPSRRALTRLTAEQEELRSTLRG